MTRTEYNNVRLLRASINFHNNNVRSVYVHSYTRYAYTIHAYIILMIKYYKNTWRGIMRSPYTRIVLAQYLSLPNRQNIITTYCHIHNRHNNTCKDVNVNTLNCVAGLKQRIANHIYDLHYYCYYYYLYISI